MSEFRSNVTTGLKWSGLAQIAQQLLQFAIYIALARLLNPWDFGLMGMLMVLIGFADLLMDMGLGAALVQKQDIEERHLNSIFWANVATGITLTLVFVIFSAPIADFYNEPVLKTIIIMLSLNLALGSLNIVQRNILMKAMDFRRIFFADTTAAFLSGLTALLMALSGLGVWSLVAQSLMITLSSTVMLWYLSSWRPALKCNGKDLRELFGFSANLMGFNVLDFLMSNIDKVLIGRYIGSAPLGVYTRAYQLMLLPVSQVSSVITRVMFPALSSIQSDRAKVKDIYLRSTRIIALVTFPVMMGLLAVARPFILSVFGDKWEGVTLILQIFCLTGMGQSIGTTLGWIYTSQGRTDILFKWGAFAGTIRIVSIIIGLHWGIAGVATAYLVSGTVFLMYPGWTIAGRLINMDFGEMVKNLAQPFVCAAVMALAVWGVGLLLPGAWPQWGYLAVQVLFGILFYTTVIHLFSIEAYREVREALRQQLGSRFPSTDT